MFDFSAVVDVSTTTLKPHGTCGLYLDANTALGINITRLVANLIVPEDYRKRDVFDAKGLILVDSSLIPVIPVQQTFSDMCMMDWAKIAGANHGLSFAWTKGDHSLPWFLNWMKNTYIFAIGWVPGVGPFLAAGSAVLSALCEDPDTAFDTLQAVMPTAELVTGIVSENKSASTAVSENVEDGVKLSTKKPSFPSEPFTAVSGDVAAEAKESKPLAEKYKEEAAKLEIATAPAYKAISEEEFARMVEADLQMNIKESGTPMADAQITKLRQRLRQINENILKDEADRREYIKLPDHDYDAAKAHVEKLKASKTVKVFCTAHKISLYAIWYNHLLYYTLFA
jgi:hypothetical protein